MYHWADSIAKTLQKRGNQEVRLATTLPILPSLQAVRSMITLSCIRQALIDKGSEARVVVYVNAESKALSGPPYQPHNDNHTDSGPTTTLFEMAKHFGLTVEFKDVDKKQSRFLQSGQHMASFDGKRHPYLNADYYLIQSAVNIATVHASTLPIIEILERSYGHIQLLEFYVPDLIRWLVARSSPQTPLLLGDDVLKEYEAYEHSERVFFGITSVPESQYKRQRRLFEIAHLGKSPVSYRAHPNFTTLVHRNRSVDNSTFMRLPSPYDELSQKIQCARVWISAQEY